MICDAAPAEHWRKTLAGAFADDNSPAADIINATRERVERVVQSGANAANPRPPRSDRRRQGRLTGCSSTTSPGIVRPKGWVAELRSLLRALYAGDEANEAFRAHSCNVIASAATGYVRPPSAS
ncbi:MAG: hypothetical protein JO345_03920 [Streptosporangiaceae bacterium]|nr:hypothetical protein [Streptosporangiaceae bacterium]